MQKCSASVLLRGGRTTKNDIICSVFRNYKIQLIYIYNIIIIKFRGIKIFFVLFKGVYKVFITALTSLLGFF
jgi:hypothetical protein